MSTTWGGIRSGIDGDIELGIGVCRVPYVLSAASSPCQGCTVQMLVGRQGRAGQVWRSDHRPSSDLITQITVGLRLPWRGVNNENPIAQNSNGIPDCCKSLAAEPWPKNIRWQPFDRIGSVN